MKNEKIIEYNNLKKIIHRIYCEQCDVELVSTGLVFTTYPEQYQYVCPKCNKITSSFTIYPWTEIIGDKI